MFQVSASAIRSPITANDKLADLQLHHNKTGCTSTWLVSDWDPLQADLSVSFQTEYWDRGMKSF